jgi:lytic murein transglycosylase
MRGGNVRLLISVTFAALAAALAVGSGFAADCQHGDFGTWLEKFKKDAAAQGISQRTIDAALNGVAFDQAIIDHDHSQTVFQQSFEQFSGRMVSRDRLRKGENMLKRYASILDRIEERYGVPGPVLVAIWGLETDFGVNHCRRSEKFRAELLDALRIIERGDLTSGQMIGAWAGEIGQTQFLPSSYVKYAVDFDQLGHRDLIHSSPNALASTANYLKSYGWVAGQPWTPGSANYAVLLKWNESEVYSKTVALFATRLSEQP